MFKRSMFHRRAEIAKKSERAEGRKAGPCRQPRAHDDALRRILQRRLRRIQRGLGPAVVFRHRDNTDRAWVFRRVGTARKRAPCAEGVLRRVMFRPAPMPCLDDSVTCLAVIEHAFAGMRGFVYGICSFERTDSRKTARQRRGAQGTCEAIAGIASRRPRTTRVGPEAPRRSLVVCRHRSSANSARSRDPSARCAASTGGIDFSRRKARRVRTGRAYRDRPWTGLVREPVRRTTVGCHVGAHATRRTSRAS
jgi:hypothetical protein